MAGKRKRMHAGEKERAPLQPTSYSFFEDVYAVVRMIPPGRVTSYGAIAAYLGTRMSARMVGWAMNASHSTTPPVPAHRVVNRNGQLSGKAHFGSANEMQTRLEMEGIQVKEDQVVDFKSIFWDPKQALEFN
jgi:methylated-DNA-protein-cysteine methyltransferase-like protein